MAIKRSERGSNEATIKWFERGEEEAQIQVRAEGAPKKRKAIRVYTIEELWFIGY